MLFVLSAAREKVFARLKAVVPVALKFVVVIAARKSFISAFSIICPAQITAGAAKSVLARGKPVVFAAIIFAARLKPIVIVISIARLESIIAGLKSVTAAAVIIAVGVTAVGVIVAWLKFTFAIASIVFLFSVWAILII
jgi:hypothetical protein